jgi:VIT1/CCC1 family predicted Fe2+/Mn2+ transporter
MVDPDTALRAHAREELGIDPDALGSPVRAALSSFLSFSLGAFLPLLPWLVMTGTAAIVASVVLGVLGAGALGVALAGFTQGSRVRLAARYVAIALVAGAVTYGIGTVVGVST